MEYFFKHHKGGEKMFGQIEKAIQEAQLRFPKEKIMGAIIDPLKVDEVIIFKKLTMVEYDEKDVLTRVRTKRS